MQISSGNGEAHLIQFDGDNYEAPVLCQLLSNIEIPKIFHFARFDLAVIKHYLQISCGPVFCTKIASLLTRTYTDKHGLRDLCGELLGIEISKEQQQTDWAAEN
jgi:Ribonuclease D